MVGRTRVFDAIRERFLLIVVVVLAGIAGAALYLATTPKTYQATADILVTPDSDTDTVLDGFPILRDSAGPGSSVLTAARLATAPDIATAASRRLGFRETPDALLQNVTAEPVGQANILSIVAQASSADRAAAIANAFAAAFVHQRTQMFQHELGQRLTRLRQSAQRLSQQPGHAAEVAAIQGEIAALGPYTGEPDPTVEVARVATPPRAASSPRPALSVVIAFLAALLIGTAAAVWLDAREGLIRTEADLERLSWLPVLARFPRSRRLGSRPVVSASGDMPPEFRAACRVLAANLTGSGADGAFPRSILISSPSECEEQALISASISADLAGTGATVVAIDGHSGPASLEHILADAGPAVPVDLFDDADRDPRAAALRAAERPVGVRLLRAVSPTGRGLLRPLEVLSVESVLGRMERAADVVIVDGRPLFDGPDVVAIADAVESTLLVIDLGRIRGRDLLAFRDMLSRLHIEPTGFVVLPRARKHSGGSLRSGLSLRRVTDPRLKHRLPSGPEHDSA